MQCLTTNFFPTKAIHNQKRHLLWGLFNPQNSKIHNLIYRVNEIVEYLERFPLFGMTQELPDDKIINIIYTILLHKCQKKILMQGFDSDTKIINNIVEFCK